MLALPQSPADCRAAMAQLQDDAPGGLVPGASSSAVDSDAEPGRVANSAPGASASGALSPREEAALQRVALIRAAVAEGLAGWQIAERLGLSQRGLNFFLADRGLRLSELRGSRMPPSASTVYADTVRALHAEGLEPAEIAKRLGVSRTSIYSHMSRLGLAPPRKKAAAATSAGVVEIEPADGADDWGYVRRGIHSPQRAESARKLLVRGVQPFRVHQATKLPLHEVFRLAGQLRAEARRGC